MQIDELIQEADRVDGWLLQEEARLLYELSRDVPSGGTIVELGSWMGRSTIVLGSASLSGPRATVYAVDLFTTSVPSDAANYARYFDHDDSDYLPLFLNNIRTAGVEGIVVPIRGLTTTVGREWTGPRIDLLFIDADHSYEGVRNDFLEWVGHCSPGARCAFHDYFNFGHQGVRRFVDKLISREILTETRFARTILTGCLAITDRVEIENRLSPRLTDLFGHGVNRIPWHNLAVNFGWSAFLGEKDRCKALKYAARAIRTIPSKVDGWKLLACALIKSPN
jgi:MMP 1-O-methyltransferase